MTLRAGTRGSRLALRQTELVVARLRSAFPSDEFSVVPISTRGDLLSDDPLPEIGGKGLFTERIEGALRSGEIDIAVHSLKDLPVEEADDITVAAVLGREEARDVLVAREGLSLDALERGAVVGSSSTRRRAQLLALRPDLDVRSIRGNVETRIKKVEAGQYAATVLAAAGVMRLELEGRVAEWLDADRFLPAPGQGAIAVQCRSDDPRALRALRAIDDRDLRRATEAERAFLAAMGGGCSTPVAALAEALPGEGGRLRLRARVLAEDGSRVVDVEGIGVEPLALAGELARRALAEGAGELLARPLAGKRILVTRSEDRAGELCGALEARGARPLLLPLIRVEADGDAVDERIDRLGAFRWLVFTSQNGVEHFLLRPRALEATKAALARGLAIAAVGRATSGALELQGLRADLVPSEQTGAALARELVGRAGASRGGARPLEGVGILLPRAREGSEEIVAILRAAGAEVDDVAVYRTVPREVGESEVEALAREGSLDAVLFLSGSAVRSYAVQAGRLPLLARLAGAAAVACVGPSTGRAASEIGMAVHVVPDDYTASALVRSLEGYFARGGGRP